MRSCRLKRQSGFTLVELVIVLVIMGIVTAYAVTKNSSPAAYTLRSQAEKMARDLRHTQTLATTWGKSLTVTVAGGNSYSVKCTGGSTVSPCNGTAALTDPATGSAFTVSLQQGATLSGPAALVIDSLGKPSAAATYAFAGGGASKNVTVNALTGFVTVP